MLAVRCAVPDVLNGVAIQIAVKLYNWAQVYSSQDTRMIATDTDATRLFWPTVHSPTGSKFSSTWVFSAG